MRECWDAAGERYLAVADAEFGWANLTRPFIETQLALFEGARVLDVGCGNGRFSDLIIKRAASYLGIDWSSVIVDGARRQRPSLAFRVGDAETLDGVGDGTFDVAVALNVLQNHAHPERALKRISSALGAGGHVLIVIEHPMRTSKVRRAAPLEQVGAYVTLGLDHAYDLAFTYRSVFLGDDTPILGWHRPLRSYLAMLADSGFDLVYFTELAIHPGEDQALMPEAVKRGMVGEPVFAAFLGRKSSSAPT
ncbi:class I SAM-dependent methyltransferase [Brevundimonas sp.]|jgi:SAM-dependent methyltransferase|uniref:class I SAM-dependent methyltransferase n=1 Tax=Brevundimonas sp. TaxID=1871086 RepID=UPI002E12543A|nr:methyltransferase domain-containing protein [Brevundimonas sp.]